MARLMSVAYTEAAVRDRSKTVTRRKGWQFAKVGDRVTLCRKVMGRKPGEPLERIVDVEIVHVQRHPLSLLLTADRQEGRDEVTLEGFPGMEPEEFVRRFFVEAQGMSAGDMVTRIEWRYLDDACVTCDPCRCTEHGGDGSCCEKRCPRCGRGLETGTIYPSCADFPEAEREAAHRAHCRHFADHVCDTCRPLLAEEVAVARP